MDDCRIVLTFKEFDPKLRESYAKTYCTDLMAGSPVGEVSTATLSKAAGATASGLTIREEIERIGSGEHVPLPPIQATGASASSASGSAMAVFEVKNDTAYTLTVLFSGPTERRVEVAPGGAISVELLPGSYKLAGRVNSPNVLPSYGEHLFDRSSSGVKFYIQ